MAAINRVMGGTQDGTPCQDGAEEAAHNRTWQPHGASCAGAVFGRLIVSAASKASFFISTILIDLSGRAFFGHLRKVVRFRSGGSPED